MDKDTNDTKQLIAASKTGMKRLADGTKQWKQELETIEEILKEIPGTDPNDKKLEYAKNYLISVQPVCHEFIGEAHNMGVFACMMVSQSKDMACDMLVVMRAALDVGSVAKVTIDDAINAILDIEATPTPNTSKKPVSIVSNIVSKPVPAGWKFV